MITGITPHVPTPQERAVVARWNFQVMLMVKAVNRGEKSVIDNCRDRIMSVAADAEALGMTRLPQPPEEVVNDPVFDGIEQLIKTSLRAQGTNIGQRPNSNLPATLAQQKGGAMISGRLDTMRAVTSIPGHLLSNVNGDDEGVGIDQRIRNAKMALGKKKVNADQTATATPVNVTEGTELQDPQPVMGTQGSEAKTMSKAESLKAQAAARKAAGKEVPKAIAPKKKESTPGPCLDGCGGETNSKFIPGHDARLKSLLLKIERGDEPLEALPEVVRPYVTFKKGVQETHDVGGKAVKVQLYTLTRSPVRVPGRNEIEFVERR